MSSCMHRLLPTRALFRATGAAGGASSGSSIQVWDSVWKAVLLSTHDPVRSYSPLTSSCRCSQKSLVVLADRHEDLKKVTEAKTDEALLGTKKFLGDSAMDFGAGSSSPCEGKSKRPRELVSPIRPRGSTKKSKGPRQSRGEPPLICLDDIPLPKVATTGVGDTDVNLIPLPASPPPDQPPLPPPLPTPPPPPSHSEIEESLGSFYVIDTRPSKTLFQVPLPPHLSGKKNSSRKVSDGARTRNRESTVHSVDSDPEEISVLYNSDAVLPDRLRNINLVDRSKNCEPSTSKQTDGADEINIVFEGHWPWVIRSPKRPQVGRGGRTRSFLSSEVSPLVVQLRNIHGGTTDSNSEQEVVTLDGEQGSSTQYLDSPKKSSSSHEKQFLRKRFAPDGQVRGCHLSTVERGPEPVLVAATGGPSEPDIIALDTQACSILHPSTADDFISLDTNVNDLLNEGEKLLLSLQKERKLKKLLKKARQDQDDHRGDESVQSLGQGMSPDIQKISVIDPDVVEIDDSFDNIPSTSGAIPLNYDIVDVHDIEGDCEGESSSSERGEPDVNLVDESMDVVELCESERESSDENSDREARGLDIDTGDYLVLEKVQLKNLENTQIDLEDEVLKRREELEGLRKWYMTNLGHELLVTGNQKKKGTIFSVMSYNVLAQQLLVDNKYLYNECHQRHLDWSYRWALLQHEIKELDPDVLLLQEVQANHYFSHFLPWLTFKGYEGIYKKRTGSKCDGCAIFFKKDKFSLVEHCTVEYLQPLARNVLDRDNIGIIAKLTPTGSPGSSEVCLATTHFLYNPRRHDVKLAQAVLLLTELDRICYRGEKNGEIQYCPIIVSGDFNAEPNTSLLDMMKNGRLRYEGMSSRTLTQFGSSNPILGQELIPRSLGITDRCQHAVLAQSRFVENQRGPLFSMADKRRIEESLIRIANSDRKQRMMKGMSGAGNAGPPPTGWYSHDFKFKSVYKHYVNRAPEATTFHNRWTSVDYILYSSIYSRELGKAVEGPLKLLGRYSLLTGPEASRFAPIPSAVCPSDHFPLAAQFVLKD